MLPYILLSQAVVSPLAAVIRGRRVVDVRLHFRGSLVIGLSALAALMLGVRIGGYVKLALLLVVASAINMLGDENSEGERIAVTD